MHGAIYVERSKNSKLGNCDTTYAAIKVSCSDTCPLKSGGCYAKVSFVGMVNHRMDRRARQSSPLQLARAEAKAIDSAYGGRSIPKHRDLRIHSAGDSRTIKGTRLINRAIGRWKARGGGIAFSYTHSWKHVPRKEWSNVSILASIEDTSQVSEARKQGYAPAIIVSQFSSVRAFRLDGCTTLFIPCPAQAKKNAVKKITCSSCKLCYRADYLYATNRGIAFEAHGINKQETKRHLQVIK